ncbi:MAG: mannose-1-phosphate guanylyltransferase [Spirochaetota bacterium]
MFHVVIIAGGRGERFWPRSVRDLPKQFHRIISKKTMLQETFYRVYPEVEKEQILIVANESLKPVILKQLGEIDENNLVIEPQGKNTAAAIALAGLFISRKDPQATITVLTSDHVLKPKSEFLKALKAAENVSEKGYFVTFGIHPYRPASEFGYIEIGERISEFFELGVFRVRSFREKPSLEEAEDFIRKKTFFWNSGIFTFRVDVLFEAMRIYMPELYEGMRIIGKNLGTPEESEIMKTVFDGLESISIDYGIMEKAKNIACVIPEFYWDDVGSWSSLSRHLPKNEDGNIVDGKVVVIDSDNNIVFGDEDTLISLIGVRDLIVVKDGNRLLICHRDQDQKIKELLKKIALRDDADEYL